MLSMLSAGDPLSAPDSSGSTDSSAADGLVIPPAVHRLVAASVVDALVAAPTTDALLAALAVDALVAALSVDALVASPAVDAPVTAASVVFLVEAPSVHALVTALGANGETGATTEDAADRSACRLSNEEDMASAAAVGAATSNGATVTGVSVMLIGSAREAGRRPWRP